MIYAAGRIDEADECVRATLTIIDPVKFANTTGVIIPGTSRDGVEVRVRVPQKPSPAGTFMLCAAFMHLSQGMNVVSVAWTGINRD